MFFKKKDNLKALVVITTNKNIMGKKFLIFNLNSNKGSILPVTVVAMLIMVALGLVCLQMFQAENIIQVQQQTKVRTFYAAEGAIEMFRGFIAYQSDNTANLRGDGLITDATGTYFSGYRDDKTTGGYLYSKTTDHTNGWRPFGKVPCDVGQGGADQDAMGNYYYYFKGKIDPDTGKPDGYFDNTMYPGTKITELRCIRLNSTDQVNVEKLGISVAGDYYNHIGDKSFYVVKAKAEAIYKTALFQSTTISTTLYFYFISEPDSVGSVGNSPYYYKYKYRPIAWRNKGWF